MRVGFDPEIFVRQRYGGISRYIDALVATFNQHAECAVTPVRMAPRGGSDNGRLRPTGPGLQRLLNGPDWAKDAYIDYRAGSNHDHVDVLHCTFYRTRRRDRDRARFTVVNVHDLIPEITGTAERGAFRGRAQSFDRADLILAVSDSTAAEFAQHYPHLAHKVVSTPLGVDHAVFNPDRSEMPVAPFPFVLYVGTRGGYKNFSVLPEALAAARRESGADVGLVAIGPPPTPDEQEQVTRHLPHDRVDFQTCSDDELADAYRAAEAFVATSTLEGFGLPLLEALACGTPTIASDIAPFREVSHDASRYVNPLDGACLAEALVEVLTSESRRSAMRSAGLERSAGQTWLHTASMTAEAYRRLDATTRP